MVGERAGRERIVYGRQSEATQELFVFAVTATNWRVSANLEYKKSKAAVYFDLYWRILEHPFTPLPSTVAPAASSPVS